MNNKIISILGLFIISLFAMHTALAGDIKGKANLEGSTSNAGVLVYIEHIDGTFASPKEHALMNQKDLMFIPEVLPVIAGTTVDFLNSDEVLHNVFTESKCAGSFNLGTWPKGQIRSYTFNKAGCFTTILCDVHPDMQAWIAVLQNPYYAQTNKNGEYEIKNVPAGNYVLKVWAPFHETKSTQITIKNSSIITKDFILKKS